MPALLDVQEPMLSGKIKDELFDKVPFPLIGSPKIDGIRAFNDSGTLYSRRLKPIPNKFTQELFGRKQLHGLDGELAVGPVTAEDLFRVTDSGVMSADGEPAVKFWCFDDFGIGHVPFEERIQIVHDRVKALKNVYGLPVAFVYHQPIRDITELLAFHKKCTDAGFEGSMYRRPDGPYKHGRSTFREGWLLKYKLFEDYESLIIGVEELMHNDNPATINELGRTKRSGHKANKRGGGTLGKFVCKMPDGKVHRVGGGPGLTKQLRDYYWSIRDQLPGQYLKYSSLPIGVKDLPRHAQFIGLRSPLDMSDDQDYSGNSNSTGARRTRAKL